MLTPMGDAETDGGASPILNFFTAVGVAGPMWFPAPSFRKGYTSEQVAVNSRKRQPARLQSSPGKASKEFPWNFRRSRSS